MQQWAHSIDGTQWVAKTALLAGAIGAVAVAIAAAAPIGEIAVGLAGPALSSYDLYQGLTEVMARWQTTAEIGFTRCELLRFVVAFVGIIGGLVAIGHGSFAMLRSGSPWYWTSPPIPKLRPSALEGLAPDEIDLALLFARRGLAENGIDPKWTWREQGGIEIEVRYHMQPDTRFPSGPSGQGQTYKYGIRVAGRPGTAGRVPQAEVQAADAQLVRRLGVPSQSSGRTHYVDDFGFAYFTREGRIGGLRTDDTHLLGSGHPWLSPGR